MVPFPKYPLKQVQLKEPAVLVQLACESHLLANAEAHSSMSVEDMKMSYGVMVILGEYSPIT